MLVVVWESGGTGACAFLCNLPRACSATPLLAPASCCRSSCPAPWCITASVAIRTSSRFAPATLAARGAGRSMLVMSMKQFIAWSYTVCSTFMDCSTKWSSRTFIGAESSRQPVSTQPNKLRRNLTLTLHDRHIFCTATWCRQLDLWSRHVQLTNR